MADRILEQVVRLSAAQRMALAGLPVPGADLELRQTKTKSGGTHLYVATVRTKAPGIPEREWHIARNGNRVELNVPGPPLGAARAHA